ncbi:MAG: hypothetical protein ABFD20_02220 [Anaerolineales bacterium]
MAKGIFIAWSEGIARRESRVFIDTVDQVIKWLYFRRPMAFYDPPLPIRVYGNWVIPALVGVQPHWGVQWYIEQSYDRELDRVIAPQYLELVRQEPWQRLNAHYDLALVDENLTELPAPLARLRPDHYCLGTSLPGTAALISVYHIRRLTDRGLRDRALARLVQHHLGHLLGVPDLMPREHLVRRGLEMHCSNRCVMRHAATLEELVSLTEDEATMGWPFCEECTRSLHTVVAHNAAVWN